VAPSATVTVPLANRAIDEQGAGRDNGCPAYVLTPESVSVPVLVWPGAGAANGAGKSDIAALLT